MSTFPTGVGFVAEAFRRRTLPAAAIPKGAVVTLTDVCPMTGDPGYRHVKIARVHNSDPVAGRIRWETEGSGDVSISAAQRVEVVSLP